MSTSVQEQHIKTVRSIDQTTNIVMIILYVAYSLLRRWVTEPSVFYIVAGLSLVNLGFTLFLFFRNGSFRKELNVVKPFWIIIRILFSALIAVLAFSYV